MNCDHVFDLLTQISHAPVGVADGLETHLAQCSHCRQLAREMQPAVELLREPSWRNAPTSKLASRGPWMASPARVAGQGANSVSRPPRAKRADRDTKPHRRRLPAVIALTAAVLVGVALGGWWNPPGQPLGSATSPGQPAATATLLERLGASPACLAQATNDVASLACCTRCHVSRGPGAAPVAATARVALSCQVCHAQ